MLMYSGQRGPISVKLQLLQAGTPHQRCVITFVRKDRGTDNFDAARGRDLHLVLVIPDSKPPQRPATSYLYSRDPLVCVHCSNYRVDAARGRDVYLVRPVESKPP